MAKYHSPVPGSSLATLPVLPRGGAGPLAPPDSDRSPPGLIPSLKITCLEELLPLPDAPAPPECVPPLSDAGRVMPSDQIVALMQ